MPDYFDYPFDRSTFAKKTMDKKKDFRAISEEIKQECLRYGYGKIRIDQDVTKLWIYDYENNRGASIHVDTITIDCDSIILSEKDQNGILFDEINSIDRKIEIYDAIFEEQAQLHLYELPNTDFMARKVIDEEGCSFFWRIISSDEARHLFYNGRVEIFRLYDDGSEGAIDFKEDLEESIKCGCILGIEA